MTSSCGIGVVLAVLVRVGEADAPVGSDDELADRAPRIVDERLTLLAPLGLEVGAGIARMIPERCRRVREDPFDAPVPDPVGAIRVVVGVAQDRAVEVVFVAVGGGAGGFALADDDGTESRRQVVVEFGVQAAGAFEAAAATEVPPEHHECRPVGPELRERALPSRVIEQREVGGRRVGAQ